MNLKILLLICIILLLNSNKELFYWNKSIPTRLTKNMIYDLRGEPCNSLTYSSFIRKLFPFLHNNNKNILNTNMLNDNLIDEKN